MGDRTGPVNRDLSRFSAAVLAEKGAAIAEGLADPDQGRAGQRFGDDYLEWCYQGRDLVLFCNLGGFSKPSKAEATAMLEFFYGLHQSLLGASPAYAERAGQGGFRGELVVFSGHMDFVVATWIDGAIDFLVTLD